MTKKYDATSKFFMSLSQQDWLALIGSPTDLDIADLDSDVSTVTASVDKLFLVKGDLPRIEHVEVQSSRDTSVPVRVCRYGVLIHYSYLLPVHSTVVLLHSGANGDELNGCYAAYQTDGTAFLQYHYRVVRLWELPVEAFLNAGIGVLAFAPLGKIDEAGLPGLLARIELRVERELPPSKRAEFWGGMSILMGFRFDLSVIEELMKGKGNMKESVYAQMLIKEGLEQGLEKGLEQGLEQGLERGRLQGEKALLIRTLEKRFGRIDPVLRQIVEGLSTQSEIEAFHDRALDATTFQQLL